MPDRLLPTRIPGQATILDHVLAHFMETVFAVGCVCLGVLLEFQWAVPTFNPSPALADASDWIAGLIGIGMMTGGLGWLGAILRNFRYLDEYMLRLRFATGLLGASYLTYAIVVSWQRPGSVIPYALGYIFSIAMFGQFAISFLSEARMRRTSAPSAQMGRGGDDA